MQTLTTDLEQLEQFRLLHTQLGLSIKQVENYQTRIAVAEMMQEQKKIGAQLAKEPEDVEALQQQVIITLKSMRNKAAAFTNTLIDIGKRAVKAPKSNGQPTPPPTPPETETPVEVLTTPLRAEEVAPVEAEVLPPQGDDVIEFEIN